MDTAELARLQMITTVIVMVANVILVLLTASYVYLTREMVIEMRSTRDPSVFVDMEFPEQRGRIIIGNSGQSAAKNVKFKVQDEIPWRGKDNHAVGFDAIKAITDGLLYLPPGRTFKYYAGIPDWKKVEGQTCLLKVQVEYEGENSKKRIKREYVIDFAQFENVLFESFRDPNREVAEAIRDAERSRQSHDASRSSSYPEFVSKKPCPMCAEMIPRAAKKCSHCGEFIDSEKSIGKNEPENAA